MPERIAGKTFYSPEEAKAAGFTPLTPEEIEEAKKRFAEFSAAAAAVPESEKIPQPDRMSDDLAGTEYEGWKPER
ncbi:MULTISPECIES: hypothetical protein [unclassified Nocardia]|uniref:hypothetical protein n=1 Tax=unclassified Nocardia TaxID=2637762 RepID=UPI001CE46382|nr:MULTISPECIES: hypothetical protein [unclassified Nocardia]